MTYRINLIADAWRLLRGTLVPSQADPYLQQNPGALRHRKDLFQWSSIDAADPGEVFAGYTPYRSVEPLLMQHLPASAGRRAFDHLMASRHQRLAEIGALLSRHGVSVQVDAGNADAWRAIATFLHTQITPGDETAAMLAANPPTSSTDWLRLRGERFIAPLWQSVVVDLSLLLGEHIRCVRSSVDWCFWADSGFSEPEAYGRSPWLLDRQRSGDKPHRTLVFERVAANAHNALEASLKGDTDIDGAVPLGELYTSLVSDG